MAPGRGRTARGCGLDWQGPDAGADGGAGGCALTVGHPRGDASGGHQAIGLRVREDWRGSARAAAAAKGCRWSGGRGALSAHRLKNSAGTARADYFPSAPGSPWPVPRPGRPTRNLTQGMCAVTDHARWSETRSRLKALSGGSRFARTTRVVPCHGEERRRRWPSRPSVCVRPRRRSCPRRGGAVAWPARPGRSRGARAV